MGEPWTASGAGAETRRRFRDITTRDAQAFTEYYLDGAKDAYEVMLRRWSETRDLYRELAHHVGIEPEQDGMTLERLRRQLGRLSNPDACPECGSDEDPEAQGEVCSSCKAQTEADNPHMGD